MYKILLIDDDSDFVAATKSVLESRFEYQIIKSGDVDTRKTIRSDNDCKSLISRLELFLKSIKTGIFKPCEPGHWLCDEKWCGYWPICKYGGK